MARVVKQRHKNRKFALVLSNERCGTVAQRSSMLPCHGLKGNHVQIVS